MGFRGDNGCTLRVSRSLNRILTNEKGHVICESPFLSYYRFVYCGIYKVFFSSDCGCVITVVR